MVSLSKRGLESWTGRLQIGRHSLVLGQQIRVVFKVCLEQGLWHHAFEVDCVLTDPGCCSMINGQVSSKATVEE